MLVRVRAALPDLVTPNPHPGTTLFSQKVFRDIMGLQPDSTFVDLGHGIGNTCLQASYTIGCDSKGVELVDARYFASEAYHRCLAKVANHKREHKVGLAGSLPHSSSFKISPVPLLLLFVAFPV